MLREHGEASKSPAADEPGLHEVSERGIGQQEARDDRPIEGGERRKAQSRPERRIGQDARDQADYNRGRVSALLARLWIKGILAVRMMWMMRVCVSSDSTNQPV